MCQEIKGCLYENQDGKLCGTRHVYVSMIFIAFRQ